jgi:prevent-host-death family protein
MALRQPSTPVTIPATQAHRSFGDLIRRAFLGREHFIVEKDGLPVVVIMSVAEYEEVMRNRRAEEFKRLAREIGEEVERLGLTEEGLEAKVEEVRQHLFEEGYGSPRK